MKIDLATIKTGKDAELDLDFTLDFDTIDYHGDVLKATTPVTVKGKIYSVSDKLFLSCDINTNLEVTCYRCLRPFFYAFQSSINVELISDELVNEEESDTEVFLYHDNILDFEEVIKEGIITNLPMKILCDESCQGLCSRCGKNLNEGSCKCVTDDDLEDDCVDPRLAKLKELLQQD